MSEHPIQGLMTTAMENLKDMIDVNTIIGDPVETPDGSVILAVSKVGFGFAAGGSEFSIDNADQDLPFGGGSGGGVSITPIAFLIVNDKGVNLLHIDQNTHLVEKLMDTAPETLEKVKQMFSKNKNKNGKDHDSNSEEFPEYNI